MFSTDDTVAVLVDVQEKLVRVMHDREALLAQSARLLKGLNTLGVPILCTEQLPDKLGPTAPELSGLLSGVGAITKSTFSSCGEAKFMQALEKTGRRNVLLCGIETHVCVFQTAADLLAQGYAVQVVTDATSSRTPENGRLGLARMRSLGADLSSVESALFELLKDAQHPAFKGVLAAVK